MISSRLALLALLAALSAAAPLSGQGRLVDAELRAALARDPAQAEVRIRYRLRPDSAGARVRLAAVPLEGVQLIELSVAVGAEPRKPLVLGSTTPAGNRARDRRTGGGGGSVRLEALIELPADADPGASIPVDIYYRVIGRSSEPALPRRVEIPIVAVLWPPESATPGTFRGSVSVSPDLHLLDAFPSDLGRRPAPAPEPGGRTAWGFDLPVTPALLAFTLSAAGRGLGLEVMLDVAALIAVILFGFIGWRRFRTEM